ncbi:nucleic acid binding protein [[Candida] boidinii]|nr:nucleic acid binding protein [[Candida] boidinii]
MTVVGIGDKFKKLVTKGAFTNGIYIPFTNDLSNIYTEVTQTPVKKDTLINSIAESLDRSNSLVKTISKVKKKSGTFNVFSIDVGLKNFSFCKMQIKTKTLHDDSLIKADLTIHKPIVYQWYKMNLNQFTNNESFEFTPENYSYMINKLIFELIFPKSENTTKVETPDIILIERQRFRTMGSHNIFEHILKSNILENMLYSSLNSLRLINYNNLKFQVISVNPQVMSSYWVNYYENNKNNYKLIPENKIFDKKKNEIDSKQLRIQLVYNWLDNILSNNSNKTKKSKFTPFNISNDLLTDKNNQFNDILKLKTNESKKVYELVNLMNELNLNNDLKIKLNKNQSDLLKSIEINPKGDDLSDSLLHGLNWLIFEKNKINLFNFINNYKINDGDNLNNKQLK